MAGLAYVGGPQFRAPGPMETPISYQTLLHELAPKLNPAGVEASMRLL